MKPQKDDIELICSVGELSDLFNEPKGVSGFLQKVVETVARHMCAQVCSIYLYDETRQSLTLQATEGLNRDLQGSLKLGLDEGLIGMVLKRHHSILEEDGSRNQYYKPIENSGEEAFKAFLAVPIVRGITRIGVLAVQHSRAGFFDKKDQRVLKTIATQLATTLENARMLMTVNASKERAKKDETDLHLITGRPVGEGLVRGHSFLLDAGQAGRHGITAENINYGESLEDFEKALQDSEKQLVELQQKLDEELSDMASMIFSAHILMLLDESFSGAMKTLIQQGTKPHKAIIQVVNQFVSLFSSNENQRLQEKVQDVQDLGHRLLLNLALGMDQKGDYSGQIVIARELLPSELIKLSAQNIEGLILYGGGASAHISILATSLGIRLIYTEDDRILSLPDDQMIILDCNQGNIIIDPDEETAGRFNELIHTQEEMSHLEEKVEDATFTACGERINLLASINLLSDIKAANSLKADGVGLYRSEFPFLIRNDFPTEEEQYRVYRKVTHDIERGMITLRTLDIGGDKILSYVPEPQGDNPFLGLRALRFLLKNKKIFVGQLKAMLRAGKDCDLRIMFPLVSSLDDFRAAKEMVNKSKKFLDRDELSYNPNPKLGIMVELPSAVLMAEPLAREADFISIGTNDLVQYLLGVDRTNSSVASHYQGEHPAVLNAINQVVNACKKHNCDLSVCGNLIHDQRLLYIFIGLGIRNFSITPGKIPGLQQFISTIDLTEAEETARQVLEIDTIEEVTRFLEQRVTLQNQKT